MVTVENTETSLLTERTSWLERNVVVPGCAGDRRRLEIPVVDRDVAVLASPAARESTSAGGVIARAQELHRVGNDIGCLAFRAVLRLPLAPLQPPVDRHRASLGQETGGVLALRAPDRDVEVVGLVLPLAGAPVLAARVAGEAQAAHRHAARQ